MQLEIIEIQCDSNLKEKFNEVGSSNFYKYLSPDRFPQTREFSYKIISMFGSTYQCEQLFSIMNGNKSPVRNKLNNIHINSIVKIASAEKFSPDINKLVSEKRCQFSGSNKIFK
jgi:hypothetical protein